MYYIDEQATTKTIDSALKLARQAHIDGIIAAGGAKAMNLGRVLASIYYETRSPYEVLDSAEAKAKPQHLICVPTTMRDRFLFTPYIPVVDSRSSQVKIIQAPQGVCEAVILDPTLILYLSDSQKVAMSLETLGLAIESYISPKANFFSDMAVEKAVERLGYASKGVPTLEATTPQEVLLSEGGLMASIAAATSSLGAASLLSLCLNSRYNITSSLIATILLPHIIDDAKKFKLDRLSKISRIIRAADAKSTDSEAADALAEYVRQEIAKTNLPARLKDLSVTIDQLAIISEDAGQTPLINTLQRSMTSDDLFTLIKQAF